MMLPISQRIVITGVGLIAPNGNSLTEFRKHLLEGYSKYTQTYENESLNNRDKFIVVRLEVWGFKKNK